MTQDIKNSVIVNIEHMGLGIAYEVQYLETDTYETFYVDYHALANHFDEDFNTDLIVNLSDSTIIDMIDWDIEYEEMDFYRLIDGMIVSIDLPVKAEKNDQLAYSYLDYVKQNKYSFAYYVQQCAQDDRNFFRWLFDDTSCPDHTCPKQYQELYNEYLWDNMGTDNRIDSILTVIKDSDDADDYLECNYSGTPDHMSIIISK
tara:strand:- start:7707 stop:8312 length:606 start_codon:yes stop_codon:yes gene_type:complete